jgi:hypothetical protein
VFSDCAAQLGVGNSGGIGELSLERLHALRGTRAGEPP